ncbi:MULTISPECIES: twin-arginine translocation pathway signal [Bradyrhizobium]|uniref:Twin-arginine translocation pathway signal n=1 Tax=Bradyrhizobium ottawaense TaxID=931866 RepID=A0A2U8PC05_9BRAD|nr:MULTISPECIES: twin-arginine translocation pathway signal [Bradyrhizobium]AWL95282.1 twin-arginine translocation pathway signal [Bradyrhizobium ottawaense]MBR1362715.1 twin-arginine translocation pathway signal [Bradyrhizobium ottawaense]MDA9451350.1 twin-arginine translocation pathway signal [Bradyrhizobium sp. CCBAU 21360]MDA9454923.1 twin-arginine translocation pathway signal [Bradyrhizobium sp. CCBAU 21359]MDA9518055.1 twin-arginine translocation pathway signal [Bradyrhizobium sp. CCBAU 
MAASFSTSPRGFGALLALLAAGAALSGCAGMSETVAPAFADPAKYELYDCKQLEAERKSLAKRTDDLRGLMEKAETGTGGAVVSELAYRNDYVAVRGSAQMAEDAWRRNKCRETPPEATPPATQLSPAAAAKPASKSGKTSR